MKQLAIKLIVIVLLILPVEGMPLTLKLAYSDVESYPFQMGDGADVANPPGLALDIIDNVALKLDIKVEYSRLPGKRVLEAIALGKVDGGFIFSFNDQRAKHARYPMTGDMPDSAKRIATIGYYFFLSKNNQLNGTVKI